MTNEEKIEWQKQAYGCTEAELEEMTRRMLGHPLMTAAGILSDSQELMEMGRTEEARQHINRAKWIMFNQMEKGE